MKKIIKILLILIAIAVVATGALVAFLVTNLSQNTIKKEITQIVHNKTGNDLVINGEIEWSFFPWFGVKIHDVILQTATGSQKTELAKAGEIGFSIKLLALMRRHINIGHLVIKDFNLPLAVVSALFSYDKSNLISGNANASIESDNKNSFNLANLTIDSIDIENGTVFWQNQKKNKKFEISKLNLYCKGINFNKPFEIKMDFDLRNPDSSFNGQVKASARIKLDFINKIYALNNLQLSEKVLDLNTEANIILDLNKQQFVNTTFQLQLGNMIATGSLHGNSIIDAPNFTGSLTVNKLNVDTLAALAVIISALSGTKSATPDPTAIKTPQIKFAGDLKVDAVQIKQFNLDNLSIKIVSDKGIINCSDIAFDLYHGKANGIATIDIANKIPKVHLKLLINDVAMQPLLIDLAKYNKFTGVLALNIDANLSGTMLNSLGGYGNVSIVSGSCYGVDIPYEVRRAHAILNHKEMPQESKSPHTEFDKLTSSFKITNALLRTNDFLIQASDYKVTGDGSANLASEQLDLRLNAYSTHDGNFFVPIKISGYFDNLTIRPDVVVMVGQVVKKEIKKQLEKIKIPQQLLNILPIDKLIH